MGRIVRETVADRTVSLLRQQILDGELRPGDSVTEEAMVAELGVSRPTVRQALNTLHVSGLLTRHPSTRVLEVTTVTHEDIVEIYRARRFLELAGSDAAADTPPEGLAGSRKRFWRWRSRCREATSTGLSKPTTGATAKLSDCCGPVTSRRRTRN